MSTTYKIVDLPGLKGLFAIGSYDNDGMVEIEALVNANITIGDRQLKYPLPARSVFISEEFLEVVKEDIATREFAFDNPFGKHLYEGRFQKDNLEVIHVVYEDALTVTIIEKADPRGKGMDRPIFTGNFFDNKMIALEMVEDMLHGNTDPDDLVFELKNLQGE